SRDADIEQSGLPASVQKLLKAIRELQRQIAELTLQIQQALKDPSLTDEERKSKAAGLQAVMSMLQAQISTSSDDLSTLMNRPKSSNEDKAKAGILIMAKT
ncbi:FlxA-like family protein, partial [Pseudomonas viridiflava]|uniref:FlxA-like family protein n=1 Tax=Pseudomonas viridiflava TaxID=33069 RepID=UPI0019D24BFF